jgi:heat-inducible transcriptional repressor
MEPLTERQDMLLGLIVREYVEHAQPIGSKYLVETFTLDLSSATVRNEMVALSDAGYLRQPYTSAGRVPTEKGYRYFVQRLIGDTELPTAEKRTISHQFFQARGDMDQWMRLAASILAQHSSAAAMVTAPVVERAIFQHVELISIQGRQVLLVLVLQGGDVQQQFLTLEEPISQAELAQAAAQLNALLEGSDYVQVEVKVVGMPTMQQAVSAVVLDLMRRADSSPPPVSSMMGWPMCSANPNSPTRNWPAGRCASWKSKARCIRSSRARSARMSAVCMWSSAAKANLKICGIAPS